MIKNPPSKEAIEKINRLICESETYDKILECHDIKLEKDPNNLYKKAWFYFNTDQISKAIDYFDKAMNACKIKDIELFRKIGNDLKRIKDNSIVVSDIK